MSIIYILRPNLGFSAIFTFKYIPPCSVLCLRNRLLSSARLGNCIYVSQTKIRGKAELIENGHEPKDDISVIITWWGKEVDGLFARYSR